MSEPAPPYGPPLLCRIGLHHFGYSDSCRCVTATRCHRCNAPKDKQRGVWQDGCRRLVTEGRHPAMPWSCLSVVEADAALADSAHSAESA